MSGRTHQETLIRPYTFPKDVKVLPVSELADHVRAKIGAAEGDFAVTRPGHRSPSRIVDRDTLELLEEFIGPTSIGEAVARFAHRRGLDPEVVLRSAFPVLQSFTASLLLVPEDSVFADGVVASFVTGQMVVGHEIRRLVQVLRDTEVYLARAPGGEDVALKVARTGSVEAIRPMLAREADVLEYLAGTGSPRLITRELDADCPFVSMEWLPGVSASARAHELRAANSPDWRRRLHEIVARLIGAYRDLHALDVVHADVHSGNVMVDADDRIRLLDFGFARLARSGHPHDHSFRTGFSRHMEPEAALGLLLHGVAPGATFLGEQYSVASLAYTLLCGEHYTGPSAARDEMIQRVINDAPLPFARHGWQSWPGAERVLGRALAKEPEGRFESMEAFLEAWREVSPPARRTPRRGSKRAAAQAKAFQGLVDEVLDRTVPADSRFPEAPTASVQYGSAGLAYFLYRASLVRESPSLLSGADRWSRYALAWLDTDTAFEAPQFSLTHDRVGPDSLYHSAAGVHVVHALVSHARGDLSGVREQVDRFTGLLSADGSSPEVALGSSGALLGGAMLLELLDSTNRLHSVTLREALAGATDRVWEEARPEEGWGGATADRGRHLGVAHGLAGVLYAQLRARAVLGAPWPPSVIRALEELVRLAEPVGRGLSWPGTVPHPEFDESTPDHAPGWCAGTAGHVHLWTLAAEITREPRYREVAEKAAWHCWEHPDRAGHLCCGLSGRVFALLRMYQHSGDPSWLDRARHLSVLSEPWLLEALSSGHRRLSLYWGALGPLLAHVELGAPESAPMPLFGSEGWRSREEVLERATKAIADH